MPKITKDMVLEGYSHKVDVPAPEYGEDAVFTVSSPSTQDITEARLLRMRLSEIKPVEDPSEFDPSKVDMDKALVAEDAAKHLLIAKALTRGMEEEWTVEDVKKIKPMVLQRLWETVDLLIGYTAAAQAEARNFRRARKGNK